ncbi:MAG: hypothetical protein CBC35_08630 [Planctomycetes bacterium TMED75]|nr:hypothetical protein [Planctomycetaceae bacterium]OUU91826.1 MAG: hypothetical protein CBC35_08630 [Planctomycetes bacterium TMED75]
MSEPDPKSSEPSSTPEVEQLSGWPYKSRYQQAPVDHFSVDRLPSRSRKTAMLLAVFLGIWGVQRLYLRRPLVGWICFIWSKIGVIGGLVLLLFGLVPAGLILLIAFPFISWLVAVGDLVALASGAVRVDGLGKPLDP